MISTISHATSSKGAATPTFSVSWKTNTLPPTDESAEWEACEYQFGLFAWAAEQVRPTVQESTWDAFRLMAVEGKSSKEVAERLGMTVAAVYLAKSRVMMRLRTVVREAQDND